MYTNSPEKTILDSIAAQAADLVWWKPEQMERGEHLENNPRKGERPWIIPETTGKFLYDTIITESSRSVLELGTSIGYSSIWMAYALRKTTGHLYTIEHSHNKVPVARKHFSEAGVVDTITLYEGSIGDIIQQFPNELQFDGLFMDADRGHYHEYFPILEKHLMSGAWVIADNAGNMQQRMKPFLELLITMGWQYEILDFDNGLLVAYRSGGKS